MPDAPVPAGHVRIAPGVSARVVGFDPTGEEIVYVASVEPVDRADPGDAAYECLYESVRMGDIGPAHLAAVLAHNWILLLNVDGDGPSAHAAPGGRFTTFRYA